VQQVGAMAQMQLALLAKAKMKEFPDGISPKISSAFLFFHYTRLLFLCLFLGFDWRQLYAAQCVLCEA